MSIKKEVFKQTGAYLMSTLQQFDEVNNPQGVFTPEMNLPGLKWFDKQMGQFSTPEQFYGIPLPCILMEYGDFTWQTIGQNQQRGNGVIRFYIYFENYADSFSGSINEELALQFFEFSEQVHGALQGFAVPGMTSLDRTGDNEDNAQDMIITSVIEYNTILTDTSTDPLRKLQIADAGLKVSFKDKTSRPGKPTFKDGFIIS